MRPIIFICHSLGGIVCKQVCRTLQPRTSHLRYLHANCVTKALVLAHEDDTVYRTLLDSVSGIVFMGTPHRGSSIANLGSVVGRIVNTCSATTTATLQNRVIRTDLLDYLNHGSKALHDLAVSVRNRLQDLVIISFYETEALSPLSSMVSVIFFSTQPARYTLKGLVIIRAWDRLWTKPLRCWAYHMKR